MSSRERRRGAERAWQRPDAWRAAAWLGAVPGAVGFAVLQVVGHVRLGMVGADSHAYWLAAHDLVLGYELPAGYRDAFLYSPAFAQVLWPVAQLGWPAFQVAWLLAQLTVLAWLVRGLRWWRQAVLVLAATPDLVLGNVYVFFAALLVLVVRPRGEGLVPLLLTKAAPAVAGLWSLARGEWRALARAATVCTVVVAVSASLDAGAWLRWVELLLDSAGSDRGLVALLRLAVAAILVVVASRSDRSVLLAPALVLACPIHGGWVAWAVLVAMPRLLQRDRAARAATEGPDQGVHGTPLRRHPYRAFARG